MMSTRRSLGRLIVRGGFFRKQTNTNYTPAAATISTTTTRRINSNSRSYAYAFHRSSSSLFSQFGGHTECKHYHTEAEAGGGNYTNNGKEVEKQSIEKGDAISLKDLLFTPNRDYLIRNNKEHVRMHTLEDKVVALYFYHVDAANDYLTTKLKSTYEELAKIKKKFEVVLVYISESSMHDWNNDESFWEKFKSMPWLALPFGDESYKKLRQIFEFSNNNECEPKLVIFGPHAEFIEPFGASFLFRYNIPGYPFTRKKAAELETEKIKDLKLEMLWDPNTVFGYGSGSKVPFSELFGKRVMLVLERYGVEDDFDEDSPNTKFLLMLKGRYNQMKGTDDEFEVIRIQISNLDSYTSEVLGDMPWLDISLGDMPWLVSLPNYLGDYFWFVSLASELRHDLGSSEFWYGLSIAEFKHYLPIFAFDRDGRLVRKTMYPTFEDMEFPFYAGGLEEETMSQLIKLQHAF